MIDGRLFPPPAKILSATIGITFVGQKGLRESTASNVQSQAMESERSTDVAESQQSTIHGY